jgi:hypothetical protein
MSDWVKLTRPDGGPVWLKRNADYWRIMTDPNDATRTDIWCGDATQAVKETPEAVITALAEGQAQ